MPRGLTGRQAFRADFQVGPKLLHLPASAAWLQRKTVLCSGDSQAKVRLVVARGVAPERRGVQTGVQGQGNHAADREDSLPESSSGTGTGSRRSQLQPGNGDGSHTKHSGAPASPAEPRVRQTSTLALAKLPNGRTGDLSRVRGCILDGKGHRLLCPCCEGKGFVKSAKAIETCPLCQQWPTAKPLRVIEDFQYTDSDPDGFSGEGSEEDNESSSQESNADIRAWQQSRGERRTVKITPEQRAKTSATKRGRPGLPHQEVTKRRIAAEMRKLQESEEHRRRISESLRGKRKVCSLCGEEGHNRRGCPQNPSNQAATGRARTKRKSYAEVVALREKRREERRNKPKSKFKGLSWEPRTKRWHAQLWTGSTVKSLGYFEDEEEGAREYDKAALAARGPGVELNFPQQLKAQQKTLGRRPITPNVVPLPMSSGDSVALAVQSIVRAWRSGVRRQRVEFLLPVGVDGEAGGLRQEFKAARDLVEATLVKLKQLPEFGGRISVQWLDKTDCVGSWQSEKLAAVVFCTADCLPQLRNLDGALGFVGARARPSLLSLLSILGTSSVLLSDAACTGAGGELGQRLTLVFNPQWQIDGQVVSDFGFGRSRREAEEFVRSFEDVFFMQQRRVMGDSIRLFKCFSSKWQVHYVWPNKRGQVLVSADDDPPTYERLLELVRSVPGSKSSRSWVERVLNTDWMPGSPRPSSSEVSVSGSFDQADITLEQYSGNEVGQAADQRSYPVKPRGSRAQSQADLQAPLASMSTSPVTAPKDSNPVASPKSLAVAAGGDDSALDVLRRSKVPEGTEERAAMAEDARQEPVPADKKPKKMHPEQPDRFAEGRPLLDPVMHLSEWQRQMFGNAFGRDRDDSAVRGSQGPESRRASAALLRHKTGGGDASGEHGKDLRQQRSGEE